MYVISSGYKINKCFYKKLSSLSKLQCKLCRVCKVVEIPEVVVHHRVVAEAVVVIKAVANHKNKVKTNNSNKVAKLRKMISKLRPVPIKKKKNLLIKKILRKMRNGLPKIICS